MTRPSTNTSRQWSTSTTSSSVRHPPLSALRIDEKNKTLAASLKGKVEEYFNRASYLKKYLKQQEEPQKVPAVSDEKDSTPKTGGKR